MSKSHKTSDLEQVHDFVCDAGNQDIWQKTAGVRPRLADGGVTKETPPNVKQEKMGIPKKDLKDIECFNCYQKGHYASNCPDHSLFCMERRLDHHGITIIVHTRQ